MQIDELQLKKILLDGSYLSEERITEASLAAKVRHMSLADFLIVEEDLTADLIGQAVAESLDLPYTDLKSHPPSKDQVEKIPELVARKLRLILISEDKNKLTLATDSQAGKKLAADLKKQFPGKNVVLTYSLSDDIDAGFLHYQKVLEKRLDKIIEAGQNLAPLMLDEIFSDALTARASDIHFEPQAASTVVRFRVDGILREVARIPKEYYDNVLNRLKVQGRMRIDEHFAAQDGAIRHDKAGQTVDIRVSIVPTIEGEKVVMRLLAAYVQNFSLATLGLSVEDQQLIEATATRPYGMILVVGPTGSGKTTTLYALLKLLNRPGLNLTTIEDPVEYKVVGVNQIQVNTLTDLTFSKGLRSIVRQDPDIILVGEIRDHETVEIAVNAALTGHMLLSTFHANDAASAIPRLLDMGTEPFLLASTLSIIVAQRLVRTICSACKFSVDITAAKLPLKGAEKYFGKGKLTLYEGKKCQTCNYTGFSGRLAVMEIINITPELKDLMLTHPSAQQVWQLARKQGSVSMFEDGVHKVKTGLTTLSELLRVAEPPAEYNK